MAPYPKFTTYPPLSQLSIISPGQDHIPITVVLEWDLSRPTYPFEISIVWTKHRHHNTPHESRWPTIPLTPSPSQSTISLVNPKKCQRAVYTGVLRRGDLVSDLDLDSTSTPTEAVGGHYLFTVGFRVDAYATWQLISVLDGTAPGELILQRWDAKLETHDKVEAEALLRENVDVADGWSVTVAPSVPQKQDLAAGAAQTFVLESVSAIPAVDGSGFASLPLGKVAKAVRYFSVVRLEPYWLGPRQGKGPFFYVGEDAIVVSCLLDNGVVVTFVVIGWADDVYQILRSGSDGGIVVAAQNDSGAERRYTVVVSIGLEFERTMEVAMGQVRNIVAVSASVEKLKSATEEVVSALDLDAASRASQEWMDSLSFCTWNALGQDLTQDKIMDALEELRKNDVHISTLLIDDNWQTLGDTEFSNKTTKDWTTVGFADMKANTAVAPTGLKDLVSGIRQKYPSIKDIGVWHALMGYWGGIAPNGSIAKQYQTTQIDTYLLGNRPAQITTIAPEALHGFYDDFYAFLRDAGLTFVKTDVQHMLSMYQTSQTRRDLISTYQSAWTCAHLKYFGGKAISCMSQTPQAFFYSLLQQGTPAIVHRNSDDFYPEVAASHPWHVWVNAHNAHFTQHLNVVLDWDMFQTDHEFSAYHAAARCVSGGPVLITDVPGRHNLTLLDEMMARAPGGASLALRTKPGVSSKVFNLYTEQSLLKIVAGTPAGGVIITLFNIGEREIRDVIHVSEFALPENSAKEVLIRTHQTGETFGPIPLAQPAETDQRLKSLVHVWLDAKGWDIMTAQPIHLIEAGSGFQGKVCILGLIGKMTGAAAVTASSIAVNNSKTTISIGLKALGKLGIWFDGAQSVNRVKACVQGCAIEAKFLKVTALPSHRSDTGDDRVGRETTQTASAAGNLLDIPHIWEIDVEAFWKEEAMWDETCKEVFVEFVVDSCP